MVDPIRPPLTPNQTRFYAILRNYMAKWGTSPSIKELRDLLGVPSLRSITQYLDSLQRKGYIHRVKHQKRSISLVEDTNNKTVRLPVLSAAGCDNASVLADQLYDEYIQVNEKLLKHNNPNKVVAIKAVGKSMVDAGIFDGDYVITKVDREAHDNDLVVAIIDGIAVIKKITFTNNAAILSPVTSDKSYSPIIMQRDFQIFGKVIDSIKIPKQTEFTYEYY
jgi:repressor LexA